MFELYIDCQSLHYGKHVMSVLFVFIKKCECYNQLDAKINHGKTVQVSRASTFHYMRRRNTDFQFSKVHIPDNLF